MRLPQALQDGSLIRHLVGDPGEVVDVRFGEGGAAMRASVPGDELFGAVKDVLLVDEYERAGVRLRDAAGGAAIDLGAHVGLFSLRVARWADAVHAYEADQGLVGLLEQNLLHACAPATVHRAAVWTTTGSVTFTGGSASGEGVVGDGAGVLVPSVSLTDVLSRVEGPVSLLKLDIEGAEFPVLDATEDAVLRRARVIVGEIHAGSLLASPWGPTAEARVERLRARFGDAGFDVQIRTAPSLNGAEAVARVLRNRRRIHGLTRLKLTVAGLYASMAVTNRVPSLRSAADVGHLRLLYAIRRD